MLSVRQDMRLLAISALVFLLFSLLNQEIAALVPSSSVKEQNISADSRRTAIKKVTNTLVTTFGANALSSETVLAETSTQASPTPHQVQTSGILWHSAKQQAFPAIPATLNQIIHSEWLGSTKTEQDDGCQETSSGIVCISERHDDFEHHSVQLKCLQSLNSALSQKSAADRPQHFSVGMECFQRRHQRYLDRFLADTSYKLNYLKQDTKWDTTWGYDFLHYAPILLFCKMKGVRIFGIHPTDEAIASVRVHGVSAVPKSILQGVTTNDVSHFEQFKRIHHFTPTGVNCVDEAELQRLSRLYEVQCFREEFMAESISTEINRSQEQGTSSWVAVLAGENHIVGRGGIPFRALRRTTAEAMHHQQEYQKQQIALKSVVGGHDSDGVGGTQQRKNRGVFTIMPRTVEFPIVASDAPTRALADYVWFVNRNPEFEVNKVNGAPKGLLMS